jgi:DNA polymerase III alpha subunit
MRTYAEMFDAFGILKNSVITPELAQYALLNSVEIVEKCDFKIPKFEVDLPMVDTSELGTADPDEALRLLCVEGWNKRFRFQFYDSEGAKYWDRLQHELTLITRLKVL